VNERNETTKRKDETMDANDLTFGVEIETTIPAGACYVGGYHNGVQVPWLPEGWKAEHDGSIRASRGRVACEFVSPVQPM
jgi:hypothetical protein